jgi:hypothetical protein
VGDDQHRSARCFLDVVACTQVARVCPRRGSLCPRHCSEARRRAVFVATD